MVEKRLLLAWREKIMPDLLYIVRLSALVRMIGLLEAFYFISFWKRSLYFPSSGKCKLNFHAFRVCRCCFVQGVSKTDLYSSTCASFPVGFRSNFMP